MNECRFQVAPCPPAQVRLLQSQLGVSAALAQVLVRRDLADPDRARAFLAAEEEHSPDAFVGIEEAVQTISMHLLRGSRITIHGDYDVDGICSTAVLVRTLRDLGGDVDSYLPDRASDGYGLNVRTVQRLATRGTQLLVTADCGITAVEETAAAKALGVDVVITDHHAARRDGALPSAPIVHPALCSYPCRDLCATAVAHKLSQALFAARGRDPRELHRELDLVALATIADVVALLGENRALVRTGLRALASTTKPGLRALMAVARVDPGRLNERSVAFALAPRLNAAGRLYRADAGLELILTEDRARAGEIAQELDRANHERRQVELGIRYEAEAQMDALGERAAYVLSGEGWHAGVIGIVASRLVERSRRPVVLIASDGETGRGSGRSIEGFDLLAGLSACAGHLLRFGGHSAAAGLEIERGRIDEFAVALSAHAEQVLAGQDTVEVERVDAVVGGDELNMDLAEELQTLAPFGRANPGVSLLVADATFADATPMGEGKHVRFTVRSRGARARAVAFGNGGRLAVRDGVPVQATFTLEVNEYNGVSEPRLVLRRAQPALDAPERELVAARAVQAAALETSPEPEVAALAAPRDPATEPAADQPAELVLFALP